MGYQKPARGFVHFAAGTRKSGQWSLVPSYGWGLDYPKVLHKFRSFGKNCWGRVRRMIKKCWGRVRDRATTQCATTHASYWYGRTPHTLPSMMWSPCTTEWSKPGANSTKPKPRERLDLDTFMQIMKILDRGEFEATFHNN